MRARVTVVIATRNRRPELLRTLGRLHRLPERPPVVVVDNASADGSAAAVREHFPAVVLRVLSRNAGAAARNAGVALAATPYVARCRWPRRRWTTMTGSVSSPPAP
jgi:GT2 family glycosyltransferase